MRITALLLEHVVPRRLGRLLGETGFVLARNPDTVRAPDLAFVRRGRLPERTIGMVYIDGAPDLAVEVLSPSDSAIDMEDKVAEYLGAGGRLVWVVNPKRRTITVHAPEVPPRTLHEHETLDGGEVLPGFTCVVRDALDWPE
jgi:Uma2 family endonuclease